MTPGGPVITVGIELDPHLEQLATAATIVGFTTRVEEDIRVLLSQLGLEGQPAVSLAVTPTNRLLRIRVQGRLLAYPPELLQRIWLVQAPRRLLQVVAPEPGIPTTGYPDAWLRSYLQGVRRDDYPAVAVALGYLRSLIVALLRDRPAAVIPEDGVLPIQANSPPGGSDNSRLVTILATLLDLGVGPQPIGLFGRLLEETAGMTPEDAAEACFTELRPARLEIRLHPDHIKVLNEGKGISGPTDFYSRDVDQSLRDKMVALEDRLFADLGVRLPSPVLVPDEKCLPGVMIVRVNHLDGLPIRGLSPGGKFVPIPPRNSAAMNILGLPAIDPSGRTIGTEVLEEHRERLQGQALLDTRGFLFEALYWELRRVAFRLICLEDVGARFDDLALAFPRLASQLNERGISAMLLTRVLRALAREGASIRDLRPIAERFARFDTIPVPPLGSDVLDDRIPYPSNQPPGWPEYLAFVRTGLSRYFSHAYGPHLRVYTLDPALESRFDRNSTAMGLANQGQTNPEEESLRDRLWMQLGAGNAEANAILISTAARLNVRQALAPEFPHLPVLSPSELRRELSIERVALVGTS